MRFSRFQLLCVTFLWPMWFYLSPLQATAQEDTTINSQPYLLMKKVIKHTLTRLKQEQAQAVINPNHLKIIVRQELMPYIHVQYMGALMLGPYFNDLNVAQKEQYFQVTSRFLEKTYTRLLNSYKEQPYQIIKPNESTNSFNSVIRLIVNKKNSSQTIKVDFKWHKNSATADWKIYDILIEGVSVSRAQQQQWGPILYKGGFDRFIDRLKDNLKNSR